MPDESTYTDHDLLIVIAERTRRWDERFEKLEDRVTDVERILDKQSGIFTGAKLLWTILGALPPSVILALKEIG